MSLCSNTYQDIQNYYNNFLTVHSKLKNTISTYMNKLSTDKQSKANKFSVFADMLKSNYTNYYKPEKVNTQKRICDFIRVLKNVVMFFTILEQTVFNWANLQDECKDKQDFVVRIILENNIRKLARVSMSNENCYIILLEETGVQPSIVYDEATKNINIELIMNTIKAEDLLYPFSDVDMEVIKTYLKAVTGLDNIVINNLTMSKKITDVNGQELWEPVLTASFNPTFTNTITTSFSLNTKVVANIKVNLIDKRMPTNFNINYIRSLARNRVQVNI